MKQANFAVLLGVLTALSSIVVLAQDDTVNIQTNLVTLNVSVTDKSGNYVRGLQKENFSVLDNFVKQDLESFSTEDSPVTFGIVYDMHPTTDERSENVLGALRQFTNALRPGDRYFVTVFNERGSLTTEFVPSRDQVSAHLADNHSGSPNSLYDAIFDASSRIRRTVNTKRILLVLTDGADHSSHHSLKELRLHLRSVNLPVYSMTFGGGERQQFGYTDIYRGRQRQTFGSFEFSELSRGAIVGISKSSGGQSFENSVRSQYYLAALFRKVFEEVKSQYVVGFYPDALDGKWHKLKVSVNAQSNRKLKVSSRKGYQSPKKN